MNSVSSFTFEQKQQCFLKLQDFLENKLKNNEPFFVGRLSGNEPNLCGKVLNKQNIPKKLIFEMIHTAGIHFTCNDDVKEYVRLYTQSCQKCHMLGIWCGGMYFQGEILYNLIKKLNKEQIDICAQALEPYYFMENSEYKFNELFKNKKVLIVTSHLNSTKEQLDNISVIHKKNIFHESTQFYVYKTTQQNGGNFDGQSWLIHMNKMKNDISNLKEEFDFDVAFVSCGGFGMLLCNFIYSNLNKNVIYVGGALQLYFGIMGNRWRTNENILKLKNDKWINVLESDKPPLLKNDSQLCENSCYW